MSDFQSNSRSEDGTHEAAAAACEAPELRQLLMQLAEQMQASEQSNTAALNRIAAQLEGMSVQAENARRALPPELVPAFERVEDAIAQLAMRVAQSATPSDTHLAMTSSGLSASYAAMQAASPTVAFDFAPVAETIVSAQAEAAASRDDEAATAAPALRDTAGDDAAQNDDGDSDIAVSVAGDPDTPWDEDAAEALTRVYEDNADEIAPFLAGSDAGEGHMSPAALVQDGSTAEALGEDERAWLEMRFSEIADQVAQTFDAGTAELSFAQISQRLTDLESRFETALADVATRADLDSLTTIESQLSNLSEQFDRSHEELNRVALIEREVLSLADRLSEERLGEMLKVEVPEPARPELDVDEIVERVAARVAEQVSPSDAVASEASSAAVSELRMLMDGLAEEQRRGGEESSAMLDAMHQAIIRLLDRMDALERAQLGGGGQAMPAMPQAAAAQAPTAADSRAEQSYAPSESRVSAGVSASDETPTQNAMLAERFHPESLAVDDPRDADADAAALDPVEDKRQKFIAAARRAAERASGRADRGADADRTGGQQSGGPDVFAQAPGALRAREDGAGSDDADDVEDDAVGDRNATPGPNNRLWVAGLALAVMALGAGGYAMLGNGSQIGARQLITQETDAREQRSAGERSWLEDDGAERQSTPPAGDEQGSRFGAQDDGADTTKLAANDRFPLGIAIERDTAATPHRLMLAERSEEKAKLSTHVGATLPAELAAPASLIPRDEEQALAALSGDAAGAASAAGTGRVMMPPAQIGPTSLRMAAANGDPSAEFEVGARFAEGRGVAQDFEKAGTWYERAAERGFALAQYRLATLFERGLGRPADMQRARYWYAKAANQGTVKAMHNLAVLTAGQGAGKPDYTTAAAWFARAAERGLADSQFNLAILYQNGFGVPKSQAQAYKWFSLAARSGDQEAQSQADAVASIMGEAARRAADAEIAAWQPKSFDAARNDAATAGRLWQANRSAS